MPYFFTSIFNPLPAKTGLGHNRLNRNNLRIEKVILVGRAVLSAPTRVPHFASPPPSAFGGRNIGLNSCLISSCIRSGVHLELLEDMRGSAVAFAQQCQQ